MLMNSPESINGPINLGNPNEFRVNELAELVIQMTNSESEVVNLPLPDDDPKNRRPEITLANSSLGWQPHVDLANGLRRTID